MILGILFLLLATLVTAIDERWENVVIWFIAIVVFVTTWLGIFWFIGQFI